MDFVEYTHRRYNKPGSRAGGSYIKGIEIIDRLFEVQDIFGLNGISLTEITDPAFAARIAKFIKDEEEKYRHGQASIFDYGQPNQTSYPAKRFCSAAIAHWERYVNWLQGNSEARGIVDSLDDGKEISKRLIELYQIPREGRDATAMTKVRRGQEFFREMILDIYERKCCLSGLELTPTLEASHIRGWQEDVENRMNPENGICLSSTYHKAFDAHLISFDEDYRLILSPTIKDRYTSEGYKKFFQSMEGKHILVPSLFPPSQSFLQSHRESLAV
ncbi:MAG: HNH endonuclease [Bacteroidales bacterium]|nr:HNH endonuclease [Bacteroidales bacterium]MCD8395307.1 HNH endonuclease [Bacteroidales bacterium]